MGVFHRLKLEFGANVFRYLCHAFAVLDAFLEFTALCTSISFDHTNTRPAVGDNVVLTDGAEGRVVQDDHSQRPFQIITNGETRWLSEDQVKLIKPLPFFAKLSAYIPLVQKSVRNAQEDYQKNRSVKTQE